MEEENNRQVIQRYTYSLISLVSTVEKENSHVPNLSLKGIILALIGTRCLTEKEQKISHISNNQYLRALHITSPKGWCHVGSRLKPEEKGFTRTRINYLISFIHLGL